MMLLWRTTINLEVLKKMNKINESARRIARKSRLHTLEKETRKVGNVKSKKLVRPADDAQIEEALKVHREQALKRGRKHKKPLKRARFSVMLGSFAFVITLVIIFFAYGFFLLQNRQSYSNLAYGVSRLTPYNASVVDGEKVSYEDYLFILKQNVHYLVEFDGVGAEKIDVSTEDGHKIIEQKKIEALNQAEGYAFVRKQAREMNIKISKEEVDNEIDQLLKYRGGSSREELSIILKAHYGWTFGDYERFYEKVLLKRKVLSMLDQESKSKVQAAETRLKDGADFAVLATETSDSDLGIFSNGAVARMNLKTNGPNFSYTILEVLKSLKEGEVSTVTTTNDAFYILKNVKTYSEDERDVQVIKLSFKPIDIYLQKLDSDGRIKRNLKFKEAEKDLVRGSDR
jgi:hypothetical protein